jgi:hypothetical protein
VPIIKRDDNEENGANRPRFKNIIFPLAGQNLPALIVWALPFSGSEPFAPAHSIAIADVHL